MSTPIISSVSPSTGDVDGNLPVLLTGSGFQTGASVFFDGVASPLVIFNNSTSVMALSPAHVAGVVDVRIVNTDLGEDTLVGAFTYIAGESVDYSFVTETVPSLPVAVVAPAEQDTVVGAVVRLDGRSSYSPSDLDLAYRWVFTQTPIGSQVEADGFKDLEGDSSVVSFAPDVIGLYVVQLIVNDGSFDSVPVTTEVTTKVVLVPQNVGLVPDVNWVWNLLSDFWTRVEQRSRFETFWSTAVQVIAAEQLKLWQYDYNKSIKDIQELIQRRWIAYEPQLALDAEQTSFILADDQAGLNASTFLIDTASNCPAANQPLKSNLITVPVGEGNFALTAYGQAISIGRLMQLDKSSFTLARTGSATRAVSRGTDAGTAAATDTVSGGSFSTGMVGMVLKFLSGELSGSTYLIDSVTSSTLLAVTEIDGSPVSFASTLTGLSYSIYPKTPNCNVFFADQLYVPTRQMPLPWRFSPTLTSEQYDFESLGVSPGDVLSVQVRRTDTNLTSTIDVQIVSVDRNRVGFVFNTSDLADGVAADGLSKDAQIKLAQDLQIPGLMVSTADGSLVYVDQALQIATLLQSAFFKRTYFEKDLSSLSEINVGPFSVTLTPLRIIRNSKVLVDADVRSIPSLQEYVKQPTIIEKDGALFQVSESKLYPIARQPYTVYENADYILDNDSTISGFCTTTKGSDLITVPYGDLLDRGIRPNDTFTIIDGVVEYAFTVVAVVDPTTIRVSPFATASLSAARFTITRDVAGNFIRFVEGTFTKSSPAPERFWAEVSFFDNNDSVENNFGVLVGVLRDDLSSVGATISYKNAIAGLMYALTKGPTLANLQLASQILLGLPFTTSAGTVVEIDPTFKTRADGSPLMGRILIAAEDEHGNALGVTNIYFYPQGRQIPDPTDETKWLPANPELSGLAINPATGEEYKVGDHVEQFAALSKGTQVQDYVTSQEILQSALNQGNPSFLIQQYHSFRLNVNSDVTTVVDTDLVAQFIKQAKPTYTKLYLTLSKFLEDVVDVEDVLTFRRDMLFADNESMSMPVAAMLGGQTVEGSFADLKGNVLSYRITGSDLVTTQGSLIVSSAAGGFVTARSGESHDDNFVEAGDVLRIKSGTNANYYIIAAVPADGQLQLLGQDTEGNAFEFESLTDQEFTVYKPIHNPVIQGTGTVTNGSDLVDASFGLASTGVAVGDLLLFHDVAVTVLSGIYRITEVDVANEQIRVDRSITEASGSYTLGIVREPLMNQHFWFYESFTPITFTQTNGSGTILFTGGSDPFVAQAVYPGDTLVNPTTAEEFQVYDFDPVTKNFYVTPVAAHTGSYSGRLERQSRAAVSQPAGSTWTPVLTFDVLDRIPTDPLFLTLSVRAVIDGGSGPDLTTTATSATVSTVSGLNFDTGLSVIPGDFLVVLEGADSTRDIGYGAGIFPILSVSTTSLTLTRPLTATHGAPGILFGIQRRRPNER